MIMNDMQDDGKWGVAIPIVDGKRPEWLIDGEDVACFTTVWHSHHLIPSQIDWPIIRKIKLRADHPHYKQAPSIDWTAPIEAVHEDGTVKPVQLIKGYATPDKSGAYGVEGVGWDLGVSDTFLPNGANEYPRSSSWSIRNVLKSEAVRTTDEQLTHYAERCKALVERMAAMNPISEVAMMHTSEFDEARAIVASMVEVDGDLVEARKCAVPFVDAITNDILDGGYDSSSQVQAALAAIRRGRALERGE